MRIPAIIISGFLGSGKTTLLLGLLQETGNRGWKPGILMNELGKEDVDGRILSGQADIAMEKLLDGCVCCNKKEELAGSLQLLLEKRPDILFIELTGVANPQEISEALSGPALRERVRNERIITLVDAEHVLEYNSVFSADRQLIRTLRQQIEAADLLVVNKTDLVQPKQLDKITRALRKINERAEIVRTAHSRVDADSLLPAKAPVVPDNNSPAARSLSGVFNSSPLPGAKQQNEHHHQHDHDETESYSQIHSITLAFPADRSIGKERLERFLHGWGPAVVRAKGYVRLEESGDIELMQYAGGRVSWQASVYPGAPYLVCIGLGLNERELSAAWTRLFTH